MKNKFLQHLLVLTIMIIILAIAFNPLISSSNISYAEVAEAQKLVVNVINEEGTIEGDDTIYDGAVYNMTDNTLISRFKIDTSSEIEPGVFTASSPCYGGDITEYIKDNYEPIYDGNSYYNIDLTITYGTSQSPFIMKDSIYLVGDFLSDPVKSLVINGHVDTSNRINNALDPEDLTYGFVSFYSLDTTLDFSVSIPANCQIEFMTSTPLHYGHIMESMGADDLGTLVASYSSEQDFISTATGKKVRLHTSNDYTHIVIKNAAALYTAGRFQYDIRNDDVDIEYVVDGNDLIIRCDVHVYFYENYRIAGELISNDVKDAIWSGQRLNLNNLPLINGESVTYDDYFDYTTNDGYRYYTYYHRFAGGKNMNKLGMTVLILVSDLITSRKPLISVRL